jgi:hypothetical protein
VRGVKKATKRGAKGPRNGGQAIVSGGQRGGGDMSGMTFVCKAVDFGAMAQAPAPALSLIGPSVRGLSAGVRATGKRGGKGKSRRGPRAHATGRNVADMKTKKGRRQRNNSM